jgi:hypothetical protein
MASLSLKIPKPALFADKMYERLVHQINEFEKDLKPNEEVGARLAQFGQSILIRIDDISWHNPHLIIFEGTTERGDRCRLLQHMNQVNVLLVALPAVGEPKKIGFKLMQELKKADAKEDDED